MLKIGRHNTNQTRLSSRRHLAGFECWLYYYNLIVVEHLSLKWHLDGWVDGCSAWLIMHKS